MYRVGRLTAVVRTCVAVLLTAVATDARAQDVSWAVPIGGTAETVAEAIAADNAGNSYIAGYRLAGASQEPAIFVAKYRIDGSLEWDTDATATFGIGIGGIAVDAAGYTHITGSYEGEATFEGNFTFQTDSGVLFVARFTPAGHLDRFTQLTGPGGSEGLGIDVDRAGGICVTGSFSGAVTFGAKTVTATGLHDVFVARYLADGTWDWADSAGGTGTANVRGDGVAGDGNGNCYVTGFFQGSVNFGGADQFTALGTADVFVAKYSAGGKLWAKQAGDSSLNRGWDVAVDTDGHAYVVGSFGISGGARVMLVKYRAADGVPLEARAGASANGIAIDAANNTYVSGSFAGTVTFAPNWILTATSIDDNFVAKYNSNLAVDWVQQVRKTATRFTGSEDIAVDSGGNGYATGTFEGTVVFDSTHSLTSTDAWTAYIVRYAGGTRQPQTITFDPLPGRTFGDPPFSVSATTTSGLPVSFSASGSCSISGTQVTITGAGSCTITASQSGNASYLAANDVPQTFAVGKATPVITWSNPADIAAGTPLSSIQLNATVTFQGNVVPGTYDYVPPSGTVLSAGNNQQLTVNFTPQNLANFSAPAPKAVLINVVQPTPYSGTAARFILEGRFRGEPFAFDDVDGNFSVSTSLGKSYANSTSAAQGKLTADPAGGLPRPEAGAHAMTPSAVTGCVRGCTDGTGAARAIAYITVRNDTPGALPVPADATLKGLFFQNLSGHATGAVYVVATDAFLDTIAGENAPEFLLAGDTLADFANADPLTFPLTRAFPAGAVRASAFEKTTTVGVHVRPVPAVQLNPGESVTIIFDVSVYAPPGAGVAFGETLEPAPTFLRDAEGNPLPLTIVGLVPPAPPAAANLVLSPAMTTSPLLSDVTVTVTALTESAAPVPDTTVFFEITTGPNTPLLTPALTNQDGRATFTYSGGTDTGTDQIQARIGTLFSDAAQVTWTAGPLDHITISPANATIAAGGNQPYTAQALDRFDNPLGDVTTSTVFAISPEGSCTGATCTASAAGAHTVTATHGGKSATATLNVIDAPQGDFTFEGFFQPVDMSTSGVVVWNAMNAGGTVPVKWRLMLNGAPVSDPSSFAGLASTPISCSSGAASIVDVVEQTVPGGSGLQYNGDGVWQYNWTTQRSYKNSCRAMVVTFSDGTTSPAANFRFR